MKSPGARDGASTVAIVLIAALLTGTLGVGSMISATNARGMTFPSLFLDPFGSFSALHLASWSAEVPPLRFPDRLVAIDGAPVATNAGERYPTATIRRALEDERSRGRRVVTLTFTRGAERIETERALRVMGTEEIAWFWGLYLLVGLFVVWSGMITLALSSRLAVARAYALWSVAVFMFLATFFDYHSSLALVPIFSASTVGVGAGFLLLALTFPEPLQISPRRLRALVYAVLVGSIALATALVAAPRAGYDGTSLRIVASFFAPLTALTLLVTVVVRYRRSDPTLRRQMRSTVLGMLAVPLFVCFGSIVAAMWGVTSIHLLIPMVMPLVPLSIGYALVRHNILGTTQVLTQRLLIVPNLVVSALLSTLLWLGLRSTSPRTSMDLALPTFLSGGLFVALVVLGHRALGRWLFPASAHFRPTVQQIADQLATLEHRDTLRETLQRTIGLWLPTDRVRLVAPDDLAALPHLPESAAAQLATGAHVWTQEDPWHRHLLVPMRSLGALRGAIVLAPKHQGALYTSEDLALLDTIASLGAVALHNAEILSELDALRRFEVEVTREDKRATLGLLGAELAHEIAHPLQLFRALIRRAGRGALSETDLEVGAEEIGRLERLLGNMRRLEAPALKQDRVYLREPVERALRLLADLLAEREVTATCEVPKDLAVIADHDALVQVFANLLRNGAQAAPRGGHVGVGVRRDGSALRIEVWDDGAGVPDALIPTLFHRWVTNKDSGTGLGLAVARNLVLNLRWDISYHRESARTVFRLTVPPVDGSVPAPAMRDVPDTAP